MKWQEVEDLFRQEVGEVSYVELFNDESGKPRGAGVMEFSTQEMAKKAINKMHRFDYKGRKIVVKRDFDAERDKHGRIVPRSGGGGRGESEGRGGGGGGGGGHESMGAEMVHHGEDLGNTFGLSPQFLDSLNIIGPLHTRYSV
jgi:RNA recognition motif-containing protein